MSTYDTLLLINVLTAMEKRMSARSDALVADMAALKAAVLKAVDDHMADMAAAMAKLSDALAKVTDPDLLAAVDSVEADMADSVARLQAGIQGPPADGTTAAPVAPAA